MTPQCSPERIGNMGLVAVFRGPDTLDLVKDDRVRRRYRRAYSRLGVAMIGLPIAAGVIPHRVGTSVTYWVEAVAVWVFAGYWLVKTAEFRETEAETRAITGQLPSALVGSPNGWSRRG